jgi:PAS domain S-box-containing protein
MERRTLVLTALYGSITVLFVLPYLDAPVLDPSVGVPVWALVALFFVTELTAVRLKVGRATWTISLVEIPRVLGLFFVAPPAFVLARLVGTGAAHAARRRGIGLANVLDLARSLAGTAAALVTFRALAPASDPLGPAGWLAAFLATAVAVLVIEGLLPTQGEASAAEPRTPRWQPILGLASALVVTGLALIGADHLHSHLQDIWLLSVPTVLLWVAVRGYAGQQQRQGMLELLFDQGVFGMGMIDTDLRITRVNEVVCRLTGYSQGELTGRPIADLVHPGDRAETTRGLAEIMLGRVPSYSAVVRGTAKDGRILWASFAAWPVRDERGRIAACLGVIEDVTEARLATERVRRTEEQVRLGVSAMTEAREPKRVLQAVVDLAREIVGGQYAAIGVLPEGGGELSDFLVSGVDDATIAAIGHLPTGKGLLGAVTASAEPIRLADLTRHPESRGFPAHHPEMRSFLGVPIAYKDRVLGNLYLANKVSAPEFSSEDAALLLAFAAQAAVVIENARMHEKERELIEQLDRTNLELKRAGEAKSVFLASMSHELRTPLHATLMAADILRDPAFSVSEARARELSDTIATSGRHLLGLIDDLLELSRIEAGRFQVRLEPTSLSLVLTECRQATAPLADKGKVRLDVPEIGRIWVEADPLRLRQALLNLLANALKFTEQGGRVWIEVDPSDEWVTIAVCDTGRGIAPDDLVRIFDPFEQGSAATHGVGLGLAISRSIAKAHGGRLDVSSELGAGSRFELSLRRSDGAVATAARNPDRAASSKASGLVVLVVEDDRRALELTTEVLTADGYAVTGVGTIAEALESVRDARPDLVLLDVKLGAEDGLEVVRRLREDPATRGIPVIASSASTSDVDVQDATDAGCTSFLAKPVTPQTLLTGVRACLDAATASDRSVAWE